MPRVSVIIPVYNGENFISETINSVLKQSFKDFEIILVDDGSKDNTKKILESFSDQRLKVLHIENRGVSNARNVGYKESKADFLAFLDADDLWLPERLYETVAYLDAHIEVGLVHTHMAVIDENSKENGDVYAGKEGDILEDLLLWNGCCIPAPSSILMRREVLENIGLFDTNLSTAADQEIFFRIANQYKIGMVSKVLGLYRIHGENMHLNIVRMEKEHIYAYNKAFKLDLYKNRSFKRKCYSNMYMILAGSYWVQGANKKRAIIMIMKSLQSDFSNVMRKLLKKIL
ncbi:glycosyltransferase [Ekhidna sp.]|uniref:glycosyltransferase n=1 Tax=Ekhidna sp. TaxID=2608089 RepID=UPI0032982FB5